MKKSITLLLSAFFAVCSTVCSIHAEAIPTVSYEGNAQEFIASTAADHFGDAFTGIAPGESRTQDFTIKNPSQSTIQVYFSASALKDLLEEGSAIYFVSLEQDGKTIYSGSLGGPNGTLTDLHISDINGASPFLLATLAPGESSDMALKVKLDGATAGNEYQNKQGLFQFTFSASTVATPTPTPTVTRTSTVTTTTHSTAPTLTRSTGTKTMDESDLRGFYVLLALSLIGFLAVNWDIFFHHRKQHK